MKILLVLLFSLSILPVFANEFGGSGGEGLDNVTDNTNFKSINEESSSEKSIKIEKDESKFYTKDYIMLIISIASPVVSIFAGWRISDWYHNKKNEPDQVFMQNRKDKFDSLRGHTGHSFSIFKEEFGHILDKKSIVEHDLSAFSSKDYSELIRTLQHNYKNIYDNWENYQTWINHEEFSKYTDFFTHMLWFIGIFQQKKFNENDIKDVNELAKKIKSISGEFDGISHEHNFTSILSNEDSRKLHRGEDFNSPA